MCWCEKNIAKARNVRKEGWSGSLDDGVVVRNGKKGDTQISNRVDIINACSVCKGRCVMCPISTGVLHGRVLLRGYFQQVGLTKLLTDTQLLSEHY